ncbi:Dipeptide and tripeptide permease A [Piscirickettsia salmonis]|uniref:Membrane protein n=2 Tax=Bacteria TaxID=2 RepID=A0A1L6TAN9_PISSA|nr:MFS transporter [Piscirickettsia salmonis]AKP73587.1 peptide transporter [Piscirickettsia salmonis LF-89 = ATCC VR-1361]ALB22349.1 membrane protein [Piscirickettsia salmonis]ALY02432.1 peptide transporter [Piscirickettsia salmonis]AMA41948.1 peptide transporter [Piscirickettsia salmonis]AOS34425.1 peptide transporter [Piscirickettsia salmonis]
MLNYKELPKGVLNINLIQVFSTVGYAVLMGLLNFYLSNYAGMSHPEANTLTASFFAINFLFHFLGGAVGGRYLTFRALFCISLFLQFIGLCLIAIQIHTIILIGMATFITGSGLNVSCINMMLTQLFSQEDKRRRIAFAVNYSFMNMGFVLSFAVAGFLQGHNMYSQAFIFAAVCIIVAMVIHLKSWKYFNDKNTYFVTVFYKSTKRLYTAPAIILICLCFAYYLMHNPVLGSTLIYILFIVLLLSMINFALKQSHEYRTKIFAYLILSSASMIFACVQGLQSTALENFVEFNTSKSLFGIPMQPATVNLFESLGVIIFGFVLANMMRKRQQEKRPYLPGFLVTRGLSLYIIAFLMVPLGIYLVGDNHLVNVIFPILLLLIVAAGEIHVNAVNYAMAGEMMKPEHQGLFTGYLFMNIAFGINLAGPISNFAISQSLESHSITAAASNPLYMQVFLTMSAIALIITLIFFFLMNMLNRMLHTQKLEPKQENELS